MHAQDSHQMSSPDVFIMTKGQDQRGSYLPPLGHSSRDTLYLQLFLSTTETSTDLPTGKSSSDSTLRSTPSSHQSTFNNLTSDPASIRRTQSHHPHTTHPLVTSPQVFTTSEFHASKLNRGFRRPPSPAIRPGKCPHCSVVLKWPNGLRKHVQNIHDARTAEYHCERCSFKHKSKNALRDHEDHYHHTCPYCKNKFTRLLQHMPYCSKRTKTPPNPSSAS